MNNKETRLEHFQEVLKEKLNLTLPEDRAFEILENLDEFVEPKSKATFLDTDVSSTILSMISKKERNKYCMDNNYSPTRLQAILSQINPIKENDEVFINDLIIQAMYLQEGNKKKCEEYLDEKAK